MTVQTMCAMKALMRYRRHHVGPVVYTQLNENNQSFVF